MRLWRGRARVGGGSEMWSGHGKGRGSSGLVVLFLARVLFPISNSLAKARTTPAS